jgi:hypothetical protein
VLTLIFCFPNYLSRSSHVSKHARMNSFDLIQFSPLFICLFPCVPFFSLLPAPALSTAPTTRMTLRQPELLSHPIYYLWVTLDPKIIHGVAQQFGLAQRCLGRRAGGKGKPEAAHRKGTRKEKRDSRNLII